MRNRYKSPCWAATWLPPPRIRRTSQGASPAWVAQPDTPKKSHAPGRTWLSQRMRGSVTLAAAIHDFQHGHEREKGAQNGKR